MTETSPALNRVKQGDLCAGCGGCAAVAPGKVAMRTVTPGYLRPVQKAPLSTLEEDTITAICPGLGQKVDAAGRTDDTLWGPYVAMHTGHATDEAVRHAGSSGGALSMMLVHLVADGVVDAVIQTAASPTLAIGNMTVITTDMAGITLAAGSRYAPSAPLEDLPKQCATGKRFAFVGKPCDVAALRALQARDPKLAKQIPVLLSFFCAGVPSHAGGRAVLKALDTDTCSTAARSVLTAPVWPLISSVPMPGKVTPQVILWRASSPVNANAAGPCARGSSGAGSRASLFPHIRVCIDIMIDIGGGDSFADIYGGRRLRRMFVLKYLTHLAGTPLVMAPQTIGPFTKTSSRVLAKLSMRLCKIVAARDALSLQAARDMGVTREILLASDVALRLPFEPAIERTSGPVKVGLNVSGLLMGGGYTGQNEFGLQMDYPSLIRDLIAHFQSLKCEVHLIPHVIIADGRMVAEDDYRASEALAAAFPGTILAPAFASPSEAKSYIAGMDFFAGARMHACIAAFSTGVPVIPMAYSRKFAGLFGALGYDHTVDCTTEDTETVKAKVIAGFTARSTLRQDASTAHAEGKMRLATYESALKTLCQSLIERD